MNIYKKMAESMFGGFERAEIDSKLVVATWSHMLYVDSLTGAFKFTKLKKENGDWNLNKPVKYDPEMVSSKMGNDAFKFIAINFNSAVTETALVNFCRNVFGAEASIMASKKSTVPTYVKVWGVTVAVSTADKKAYNFTVSNWDSKLRGMCNEAAAKASSVEVSMMLPSASSWQYDTDANGKIVQMRFRYSTNGKPWFGGKESLQRGGQDTCNKLLEPWRKVTLAVIDEDLLPCESGNGYFIVRPNAEYGWEEGMYDLVRGYFHHETKPYTIVKGRRIVNNQVDNLTSVGSIYLKGGAGANSYDGITSSANLKGIKFSDLPVDFRGNAYVECFIACSKDEDKEKKSLGNKNGFTDLAVLDLDSKTQEWIKDGLSKQLDKIISKIQNPESPIDIDFEDEIEDGKVLNSLFAKVSLGMASSAERSMLMTKLVEEAKSFRSKDTFYVKMIATTHWNGRKLEEGEIIPTSLVKSMFKKIKVDKNNSTMITRAPLASPQSSQQGNLSKHESGLKGLLVVISTGFVKGMSADGDDSLKVTPNGVSKHVPGEDLIITARAPKPSQIRNVADLSVGELIILGEYNRQQTGKYANELFKFCSLVRESNLSEEKKAEAIRFICQIVGQAMELTLQGAKKAVFPDDLSVVRKDVLEYLETVGLAARFYRADWDKIGYLDVVGNYDYGFIQTYKFSNDSIDGVNASFERLFGKVIPMLPVREREDLITDNYRSNLTPAAIDLILEAQDGKITNAALGKIWASKVMREIQTIAFGERLTREFCIQLASFESDEWDLIGEECIVEAIATYANIAGAVDGFALQALNGGALWMHREYQAYVESKSIVENSKSLLVDILSGLIKAEAYSNKSEIVEVEETIVEKTVVSAAKIQVRLPKEGKERSKMLAQLLMDGVDFEELAA